MDPGQCARGAYPGREGGVGLWHRRQLAGLEAHRRYAPYNRYYECLEDHAIKHPFRTKGCGTAKAIRHPGFPVTRSALLQRSIRQLWRRNTRRFRGYAYRGHRGGPAGGLVRTAVHTAGDGEEHLWHRLFSTDEYG